MQKVSDITLCNSCLITLLALFLGFPATAFSQPGFYRIIGLEEGTQVYLNGKALQDSAGRHQPGTYTLRVEREGYLTYVDAIQFYSDHVVEIRIRRVPTKTKVRPFRKRQDVRLSPVTCTLVLTSDPPGQVVLLNDQDKGTTPIVLEDVVVGTNVIQIGEAADTLNLRPFETRRLRKEDDRIFDVTSEELPEGERGVRIDSLDLFMETDQELATNCDNFSDGDGRIFFELASAGAFLVCRMTFFDPGTEVKKLPVRFRIYKDSRLLHEASYEIEILQRKDFRVCYFHHEWWKPGAYWLTIDGSAGNRLADQEFIVTKVR